MALEAIEKEIEEKGTAGAASIRKEGAAEADRII